VNVLPPPAVKPAVKVPLSEKPFSVGPTRGYRVTIEVNLLNKSAITLEKYEVHYAGEQILAADFDPPVRLCEENPSAEFQVRLPAVLGPAEAPGEKELTLKLLCKCWQPQVASFRVRYLALAELQFKLGCWTDDGYVFQPIPEKAAVKWRVPQHKAAEKNLRIEVVSKSSFSEDIAEISIEASEPLEIPEFVDRQFKRYPGSDVLLLLRPSAENQSANLTIRRRDHSLDTGERVTVIPFEIEVFPQEDYPHYIGLDFGTSNSCVALVLPRVNGAAWDCPLAEAHDTVPVEESLGSAPCGSEAPARIMPTVMYFPTQGRAFYGRRAASFARPIENFKRLLSSDTSGEIGPGCTADDLATMFMTELLHRVQSFLDERTYPDLTLPQPSRLKRVAISVPTMYAFRFRKRIREACRSALEQLGVKTADGSVVMVDESRAALKYFLWKNPERRVPGYFVIYDFGGGTTDVTAVEVRCEHTGRIRYIPCGTGGHPKLGGSDVTQWLSEAITKHPSVPSDAKVNAVREIVKIALGRQDFSAALEQLNLPSDYPEASRLRQELLEAIYDQLAGSVRRILEDIFGQIAAAASKRANGPLPLHLLLAGNASRLADFTQRVETIANTILHENGWLGSLFSSVSAEILDLPKASVVMGAFLLGNAYGTDEVPTQSNLNYGIFLHDDVTQEEVEAILPGGFYRYTDSFPPAIFSGWFAGATLPSKNLGRLT
jgi:hypothetical protein